MFATITSLQSQLAGVQSYNKNLQSALDDIKNRKHESAAEAKSADSYVATRLSEMLISDKLIHEENTKVIAELKEAN